MSKKISIIGSGFSSLSAASYLAKEGFDVTIYEKNKNIGGRARRLSKDGFSFDMGPTWYWMPDVFEKFFADFRKKPEDYYELIKLSPAYKVIFDVDNSVSISDDFNEILQTFEEIETGSSKKLSKFMNSAKVNYEIAINNLVYKPGNSITELITLDTVTKIDQFFGTISKDTKRLFKNKNLRQIVEFPVLFLGAKPSNTPSFYNFMNHADFGLGTWHPVGGMYKVVEAMHQLALELNVKFATDASVEKILVKDKTVTGIVVNGEEIKTDIVLTGADYHHSETLLDIEYRNYTEKYWSKKTFAPSSLLFYVGFNKKLENIEHHMLFFDTDFEKHAQEIYDNPKWPKEPLFYASFPSITDKSFAPENHEAATFLIPIAPGIEDTDEIRETYFNKIIERLEKLTNQKLTKNIVFKQSYCVNDFIEDYNSYKGNAYGLANTLLQTAFLRPKLKSPKVKNLFFTGQLTVPGPGVPPSIISGKIVSELIVKSQKK
ncbi:phytoene dehydrogenase [Flavobacterium lutivivi]|nr:phytoene dehydrogenase [Flavobacterium lutivivi]